MVRYILPSVQGVLKLERRCPHCGRNYGQIHSGIRRRVVSDIKVSWIPQRRMKCARCGVTWTLHPEGIEDGFQRSRRLVGIGVMLYMLGLSYRGVAKFLPLLGCCGGKSSIERDVDAAGQKATVVHLEAPKMHVRVLGVDGTGAAMAGQNRGVLFYVGIGTGSLVAVEPIHEEQTELVRQHVRRVMNMVGASELRTDEHSVYEGIVPEGQHRLCLTHWRKSKGKRTFDLLQQATREGAVLEQATLEELLALLRHQPRSPTVPPELERLVTRYINAHRGLPGKVNQLLQHVERTWPKVSDDPTDPTNNDTERLIGLTFKIRSKTMRGFKSMKKVLAHPYLSCFLRGQLGVCDLRQVI